MRTNSARWKSRAAALNPAISIGRRSERRVARTARHGWRDLRGPGNRRIRNRLDRTMVARWRWGEPRTQPWPRARRDGTRWRLAVLMLRKASGINMEFLEESARRTPSI